jgi:STE24 endopeptidase
MLAAGLCAFVAVTLAKLGLALLNLQHHRREGHRVPPELASRVDAQKLAQIAAYTRDRARFGLVRSSIGAAVSGGLLFLGLGWYDQLTQMLASSFITHGMVFFLGLSLGAAVLSIPLDLYSDFRLEARHGFNRKTGALWWADWFKSTLLSLVLLALVAAAGLWLVQTAPNSWWWWLTLFISAVSLILTFVSPYLIEPLFYRMEPLSVPELSERVRELTARAGVQVSRILTVDASRRSSHSNAYFTGLGRVKRVVLFDTLLAQMNQPQILAVLAHELGHWKNGHIVRRLLVMQLLLLLVMLLAFLVMPASFLPELVGLEQASFAARAQIAMTFGSLCAFPLTPLFSYWSRRDEREADAFAVALHGDARDLADALAKLGSENLSNLHPHPLYAAFYYSHPPLAARIGGLRALVPREVATAN